MVPISLPPDRTVVGCLAQRRRRLDQNPLDPIEAHSVAPALEELRHPRRCMVRQCRGPSPACRRFFEIGRDADRPEAVIAELGYRSRPRSRASGDDERRDVDSHLLYRRVSFWTTDFSTLIRSPTNTRPRLPD
jgi:hypothetical protein